MKIKNISLIFTLVCLLILFSLNGYCLSKSSKNVETYDNPDIDYNSYRYFTFFTDKFSMDYLQNKSFQSSIIELLEEKNYTYVEDIKEANFVIILYSSNLYEESLVDVPIYIPGKRIRPSSLISSTHHVHVHRSVHTSGNWEIRTDLKAMYYPFIGISCIGNLQSEPELIWQGQGIKSTSKSNLEKYGKELIEEILAKFPEISEKIKEELPPIETKENENIKMLLEQLKNN
jgi:hypothetical protein